MSLDKPKQTRASALSEQTYGPITEHQIVYQRALLTTKQDELLKRCEIYTLKKRHLIEWKKSYKHVSLSMMSEYEQVWIFGKKGGGGGRGIISFSYFNFII